MHNAELSPKMIAICLAISILFLLGAIYVTVLNWACAITSLRNKRRGIDKHYSMVPIVSLILAAFGLIFYPFQKKLWIVAIPLADPSLWSFLCLPFFIIGLCFKKKALPNKPKSQ